MNKVFKDLATFIRLHDGYRKPRLDFQQMYKMFPDFQFAPLPEFGQYSNFGQAYEHKDLSMKVTYDKYTCIIIYKEFYDVPENTAYVT